MKRPRSLIAFLIAFLFALTGAAQSDAKVEVFLGTAFELTRFDELNGFVDSYNNFYNPDTPFEQFKLMHGASLGVGCRLNGERISMGYGAQYQQMQTRENLSQTDLDWNFSRSLQLDGREGYVWMEMGSTGRVSIGGFTAFNVSFARLKSYQIYPDGSYSASPEFWLNGIYRSFSMDWDLGLNLRADLGRWACFGRATLISRSFLLSADQEKELQEFNDGYTYRSSAGRRFPKDFDAYAASNGQIGQYETVGGGQRGLRLNIGIAFALVNVQD